MSFLPNRFDLSPHREAAMRRSRRKAHVLLLRDFMGVFVLSALVFQLGFGWVM